MMNEKDMQNIAIAAQYGNCGTKYLGEILDQLRIQGLDKQDMRWLCHTLATESPNIVRRLNANMNEDQFQRWMNCMHEHAENDPYMEALEYAFTVYGSNAGICKGPDAGKKETIHTHLFQSVQDHRLPLTDFVELTETYHAFWDVFRLEMESFLENLRPLDSEKDAKTAKSIIALVTDCQCTSKNKKLAAMKALRNHNVTPGSKNAEKLAIYFSEREIRYLNVILAQGKVDWLGFNYYQPTRVQAPDSKFDENGLPCIAKPYIWPERKMNVHRGWEIYPKGIYDFGMKIKTECPDLPFFISENGMGVEGEEKFMDDSGTIQDDYRIEFVRDHLEWIAKSIEDGANCLGYHYWGAIDNWSWCNAFKNRYGFVRVCLDDGYKRKEKKSASWIREVARTNEFE